MPHSKRQKHFLRAAWKKATIGFASAAFSSAVLSAPPPRPLPLNTDARSIVESCNIIFMNGNDNARNGDVFTPRKPLCPIGNPSVVPDKFSASAPLLPRSDNPLGIQMHNGRSPMMHALISRCLPIREQTSICLHGKSFRMKIKF